MKTGNTYNEEIRSVVGMLFDPVRAVLATIPDSSNDADELAFAAKTLLASATHQLGQILEHVEKETGAITVVCDGLFSGTPSYRKILGVEILKGIPPATGQNLLRATKERISCISPRMRELMDEAERELSRVLGGIGKGAANAF